MTKRVLAIILALCLLVGCMPMGASAGGGSVSEYEVTGGKIYLYRLGEEKYLFECDDTVTEAIIPEELEVTVIGDVYGSGGFAGCTKLTKVVLPNTVTRISNRAFADCSSLTSVEIGSGLTEIENEAFSSCTKLSSINLPEGLTSIGSASFEGCKALTSLTLPQSLLFLGGWCFVGSGIQTITIPKQVNWIGKFENDLKTTFPTSGLLDGISYLTVDPDNQKYFSENNALFNKEKTVLYWASTEAAASTNGIYVVPDTVTEIAENAYSYPSMRIKIGDGVQIIRTYACPGSWEVSAGNPYYSSEDGILFNKSQTHLYSYPTNNTGSYTIPAGVTGISEMAFYNRSISSVTIPGDVDTIQKNTFDSCNNLTTVTVEDGVKTIACESFGWCEKLSKVILPASITSIDHVAFHRATGWDKVNIYYAGTHEQWDDITFVNSMPYEWNIMNDIILHCNSTGPSVTPNWSSVTAKTSVPYGTKNSELVTLPKSGTATDGDVTVNGTFSVLNGDTVQACGERNVTVQFTVTSDGDYKGMTYTKDFTVTVAAKSVENSMISAIPAVTYNGAAHEPTLTVKNGTTALVKGTDYTVAYSNNTNAGTATATITGKGNYTGTASKTFTINKATITGYQTAAPTATILANDANNTAATLKTAANLPANVTVTYAGGTAMLPITWANATEKFNAKGGSYTFKGAVTAGENFNAYTTPLTATLTVTPVNGTLANAVTTSVVVAKNTAENATSYADFKLPASIAINCDNGVAQQTITPEWSVPLNTLKDKAVGSKTTVKVTNLPEWLTMNDVTVTVEITDKFPVTVTVGAISNATYGTEIANPSATQTAIDDGTDSGATFSYTYTGTTASGTAYNSATKPTEVGDYTVTATLVSNTHAGSGSTTFKILPKNLANSMIGTIASVTYNGKAQEPTLTVKDGTATLVRGKDFIVTYSDNTEVGTATATITGKGNYTGTASKDFAIDPIDISAMNVKVEGTAEVEQALLASVDGVETVEFNWFVDGTKINNHTMPYLILTSAYEDKEITVSATASGNYGGTTAVSDAKTIAPATGDVVSSDVPEKAEITASAGNQQVTVKATAESEKPIALYAFKLCNSSDNIIKTVYSLTDSYAFTDLTNGTEYHVSAVAFNVNGEGAWSDSESVTPTAPSYSGGGSSAPVEDENSTTLPNGNTVTTITTEDGELTISVTDENGQSVANINLPSEPDKGKDFTDVQDGSWYKNAIDNATGYGLFGGVSETEFEPNTGMTRGMLAQTLYNLSGKTGYGTNSDSFDDSKGWYQNAVNWAASAGVVSGNGNGKFEPNEEITREQLVVMLYNFAQAIGADTNKRTSLSTFPDSGKVSGWASSAMQWAVAEGLLNGSKTSTGLELNPRGTATRAEVATVLVHFVEYLK